METWHPLRDTAKAAALAEAIARDGWIGAPLVADGTQLLTGVHRYAAWRSLGKLDADLPLIDIRDVFAEAGLDFDQMIADELANTEYETAIVYLVSQLPASICEKYGIDLH